MFSIVTLFAGEYLLVKLNAKQAWLDSDAPLLVLSLSRAQRMVKQSQLFSAWNNGEVIAQPLLLPVRIELNEKDRHIIDNFQILFHRLGFTFKVQGKKLIVSKVPALLRQAPIGKILPILFSHLNRYQAALNEIEVHEFCCFLVETLENNQLKENIWTEQSAQQLLDLLVDSFTDELNNQQARLFVEPDLSLLLQGFANE